MKRHVISWLEATCRFILNIIRVRIFSDPDFRIHIRDRESLFCKYVNNLIGCGAGRDKKISGLELGILARAGQGVNKCAGIRDEAAGL